MNTNAKAGEPETSCGCFVSQAGKDCSSCLCCAGGEWESAALVCGVRRE
jgi:hypothetical protein